MVFLFVFAVFPVSAQEDAEPKMITVYADLSNKDAVRIAAQSVFDEYPNEYIIVEVKDKNVNKLNTIQSCLRGTWVENTGQYFIGDIFHATTGTIRCYVNGSSVSSCSGSVTIYGDGVVFKSKTLNNTSSTSANMYWEVMVSTATLGYRVYLYD